MFGRVWVADIVSIKPVVITGNQIVIGEKQVSVREAEQSGTRVGVFVVLFIGWSFRSVAAGTGLSLQFLKAAC